MRKFYWIILLEVLLDLNANAQTFSLVKDINPGTGDGFPQNLTNVNGKIFFAANDGIHGSELWKSDGTEAGTVMVKDINPGTEGSLPSSATGLIYVNGLVYFIADNGTHGRELWKSNGTEAGTVMVKDIYPGAANSEVSHITSMNGIIFFSAKDGTHGNELWKSDGTEAGTVLVKDINTGNLNGYPYSLTLMNGILYFGASNGTDQYGMWKTDGTEAGTVLIRYVTGGIVGMKNINNKLIFSGGISSGELWTSDGTTGGTLMLKATGLVSSLTDVNGIAFFLTVGSNIWKSDGTVAGTMKVKELPIAAGTTGRLSNGNGKLFFICPTAAAGTELWISDGTEVGTVMVKDIYPGPSGSFPGILKNINGKLYFGANNGTNGSELWRTDGTESGTFLVHDIMSGSTGSNPADMTYSNDKIFLTATSPQYGRELWAADISTSPGGLPLSMLDFKGQLAGTDALLNWKTVAEQNTSHFEIERNTDGRNFLMTGTLPAAGNSSDSKQYNFTDRNITTLNTPVVYYRLKMKDNDGKFTHSKIIAININNKEGLVMLYPNPVQETTTLVFAAMGKENITYRIIDQSGRILQQKDNSVHEGSNSIPIEASSLAAGMYTISITGINTNIRVKFLKQ